MRTHFLILRRAQSSGSDALDAAFDELRELSRSWRYRMQAREDLAALVGRAERAGYSPEDAFGGPTRPDGAGGWRRGRWGNPV
jgi:hypothetical protein